MKNKSKIIKDNNNVFLEVDHLGNKVYFLIQPYSVEVGRKLISLTKEFDIDLGGKK